MAQMLTKLGNQTSGKIKNAFLFFTDRAPIIRKYLAGFFLLLALASFLSTKIEPSELTVWIANQYLPAGTKLAENNCQQIKIAKKYLPENFIQNNEDWLNHYTTSGIEKNTILTKSNLLTTYGEIDSTTQIMPLNLANNNLIDLLSSGQKIDIYQIMPSVVNSNSSSTWAKKIISSAVIIFIKPTGNEKMKTNSTPQILVRVPLDKVSTLANANMNGKVTISFVT